MKSHPENHIKEYLFWFSVIFFLLISRFWKLASIPVAYHHDEIAYIAQAQAALIDGRSLEGNWTPFSFKPIGKNHAELGTTILMPTIKLFGENPFGYRFGMVLLGITFPFVLAWLSYGFFADRKLAQIVILVAVFNPWMWQFSRMSFDTFPGGFFIILGLAMLVNLIGWKKILALVPFLIGFFLYQGMKIMLVPVLFVGTLSVIARYSIDTPKKLIKQNDVKSTKKRLIAKIRLLISNHNVLASLAALAMGILCLFIYTFVILPDQDASSRLQTMVFNDPKIFETISQFTNTDRRLSLDNNFLHVFSNKFLVFALLMMEKVFSILDPKRIFLSGEPAMSPFSVWSHGIFYVIDLPLFLLGLIAFSRTSISRGQKLVFGLFASLSFLPAVINSGNNWFMFRAELTYFIIMIVIALGMKQIIESKVTATLLLLSIIYILSVVNFSYQYFYRYPIFSTTGLHNHERVLSQYIARIKSSNPGQKVVVVMEEIYFPFLNYLTYNNLINSDSLPIIRENLKNKWIELDGVIFTNDFCQLDDLIPEEIILISQASHKSCLNYQNQVGQLDLRAAYLAKSQEKYVSISSVLDAGEIYRIYADELCADFELGRYPNIKSLELFDFDKLDNRLFCQKWIMCLDDQGNCKAINEFDLL
ncbi:MAG: hypothetical protein ACOZAN_00190 [Patescibacteria group bacterium]